MKIAVAIAELWANATPHC